MTHTNGPPGFPGWLIQLFPGGNGRVPGLLTLLVPYHFNYAVGRYISLERVFECTKEAIR